MDRPGYPLCGLLAPVRRATCPVEPGHRSIDLATTTLFGGFEPSFYEAYNWHYPFPPNHMDQWEVVNFYPSLSISIYFVQDLHLSPTGAQSFGNDLRKLTSSGLRSSPFLVPTLRIRSGTFLAFPRSYPSKLSGTFLAFPCQGFARNLRPSCARSSVVLRFLGHGRIPRCARVSEKYFTHNSALLIRVNPIFAVTPELLPTLSSNW
jgi:hypothetical protein